MQVKILWIDDEIELLKPHIVFLTKKGYDVKTTTNGIDAIELSKTERFDIFFIDEQMPGISGLETLTQLKSMYQNIPIILITKSEEEDIMDQAIGKSITDYIVKPFKSAQLLLTLKKNIHKEEIQTEKINLAYQKEFLDINEQIQSSLTHREWVALYEKLIYWDFELQKVQNKNMLEILETQKAECSIQFAKYIKNNYSNWIKGNADDIPTLSHQIIKKKLFPLLQKDTLVFFILIDNLRLDHWKVLSPLLADYFLIEEDSYFSILPTATAYARNALFSGTTPLHISMKYPNLWVEEREEENKNNYESEFILKLLEQKNLKLKTSFHKVLNLEFGQGLANKIHNLYQNDLNIIIYNFVDNLSHSSFQHDTLRELIRDDYSYRSIVKSWFENSSLFEILKSISSQKAKVIITTDHGTIKITKPIRLKGDKTTSRNLRYKMGRKMDYNDKNVYTIQNPKDIGLPMHFASDSFVFATHNHFFVYPNNYNHYVNYYQNSFQHGGISMEEMIIPFNILTSKNK